MTQIEEFGVETVVSRFQQLDNELLARGVFEPVDIYLVGSTSLMLQGALEPHQCTTDIDLVSVPEQVYPFMPYLDMNTDAETFLYQFPQNWKSRVVQVNCDTFAVRLFAMSVEDTVTQKLKAYRLSDQGELAAIAKNKSVDFQKLHALISDPLEVLINLPDDVAYETFLGRYSNFLKESGIENVDGLMDRKRGLQNVAEFGAVDRELVRANDLDTQLRSQREAVPVCENVRQVASAHGVR